MLLQEKNEWQWGVEQDIAFEELKRTIARKPVLAYYDPKRPICLSTDASKDGLGAVILQQDNKDELWKPVAYASRAMTSAEMRYAQIEKELLGIVYGAERFHQFIYGATVQAETDHKPLVSLFQKLLNDCPLRVQRLLLQVQRYDLHVTYTPGKMLVVADTLSRAPEKHTVDDRDSLNDEIQSYINLVIETMPVLDKRLEMIHEATLADDQLTELKQLMQSGWPKDHHLCPLMCRPFWNIRHELSTIDDVIYKGTKIVIPTALRRDILGRVHDGHILRTAG